MRCLVVRRRGRRLGCGPRLVRVTFCQLRIIFFGLLLRLGFERRLRFADLAQPIYLVLRPFRELVASLALAELLVLGPVGRVRLLEVATDLLGQLLLRLLHVPVTHGLVLGRVGLDLRAVERDVP